MSNKLTPIKLDSYQPLREVVFETLRDAIRKGILKVFSPCVIYLDYFGIKILMR